MGIEAVEDTQPSRILAMKTLSSKHAKVLQQSSLSKEHVSQHNYNTQISSQFMILVHLQIIVPLLHDETY